MTWGEKEKRVRIQRWRWLNDWLRVINTWLDAFSRANCIIEYPDIYRSNRTRFFWLLSINRFYLFTIIIEYNRKNNVPKDILDPTGEKEKQGTLYLLRRQCEMFFLSASEVNQCTLTVFRLSVSFDRTIEIDGTNKKHSYQYKSLLTCLRRTFFFPSWNLSR